MKIYINHTAVAAGILDMLQEHDDSRLDAIAYGMLPADIMELVKDSTTERVKNVIALECGYESWAQLSETMRVLDLTEEMLGEAADNTKRINAEIARVSRDMTHKVSVAIVSEATKRGLCVV